MRRLSLLALAAILLMGCAARPDAPAPVPPARAAAETPAPQEPAVPAPSSAQPAVEAAAPPIPAEPIPVPPAPEARVATPTPTVQITPTAVRQGDFATLRLSDTVPGQVTVHVEGLDEQPRVYSLNGKPVALIGFPAAARVGEYPVKVSWDGGAWEGTIQVILKHFTEDRLVVTEEQQAIYYDPRQEEEWRRVFAVRSHSAGEPLWRGTFRLPLDGAVEITTYFGEIRYVNGVETGRHSGMDFGAEKGTPILAPAAGRVVMAEELIVTGWTIIIDHGFNLYTVYYHGESVKVKPGDEVNVGQEIGTVGSTGFSTGPHLHWTATIGNTPVDPWPLTELPVLGLWPPGTFAPEGAY